MTANAAWLALGAVVTLVWLFRHRDVTRARHGSRVLHVGMYDGPPKPAPRVSIIIAAKDEDATIERCVRSLLDQDYPNTELIVVDDRSSDRTGDVLEKVGGRTCDKLHVLNITELPPGWFGKTHAVHRGSGVATGAFLLFTDADCWQLSERTVSTAMRFAIENDIEFLSVLPIVENGCASEAMIQPVCTAVLMIWHPPERVNDPAHRTAYANGAFMLIRRDAYDRIGGHERVRDMLCEDMELARNAKADGVRLHVIQNRGLYVTRMYATLGETWRGWSRIFQGSLKSVLRIVAAMCLLLVFSIGPWVSLVCAAFGLWRASSGDYASSWWAVTAIWGACVLAQQSVTVRVYPLLGAPWWRAFSYLGGAVFCVGILMDALLKVLGVGATTWRGTCYNAGQSRLRAGAPVDESPAHAG